MSTQPTPPPAAPTPAKVARPRSPVEKFIVRGGILLLIVLAAIQAHARFGYTLTLQKLQTRLSDDDSANGQSLPISDLSQFIVGWPSRTESMNGKWGFVVYSWRGLTESYEIRMPFDSTDKPPVVLSLETADPPAPPTVIVDSPAPVSSEPMGSASIPPAAHSPPGAPGGGGGPGGGRGQRPDIMASDADGDGKVSLEEAPEQMKRFFDRMDENKDGFIDADEVAAAARRRAEREAAGGEGGGEGRPRPAAETQAPASETPEKPADTAEKSTEATAPANSNP